MSDSYAVMIDKLHTLTGAPLAVLFAVGRAPDFGQAATPAWMEMVTGLSDKTITRAAALLEAQHLMARLGPGWQITAEGRDVIALLAGAPAADGSPAAALPAPVNESPLESAAPETHRNFSGEDMPGLVLPSIKSGSGSRYRLINSYSLDSPPPPDSRAKKRRKPAKNPLFEQNLEALDECGICEPSRSRLAHMAHVTPELIRGHFEQAGGKTGLTIYRVTNNWRVSPPPEDGFERTLQMLAELPQPEEPEPLPDWAVPPWERALEQVSKELNRADFSTWVASLCLVGAQESSPPGGRTWTAAAGNPYGLEWLENHQIAKKLEAALGEPRARVKLLVGG